MEMNCEELYGIIEKGEDYKNQFKLTFDRSEKLAVEIVAFLNSDGGNIIVGIDDFGEIIGLNDKQIREINQWIGNVSKNNIYPSISLKSEILNCDGKNILIIYVPKGDNKPYAFNQVDVWLKSGSDKRKATIEDIRRLLQESGRMYAEEEITEAEIDDIDIDYLKEWYVEYKNEELNGNIERVLNSFKLAKENKLTLAGLLLFGKKPQEFKPQFIIKAAYWKDDNHLTVLDKEIISGKLIEQFKNSISFIKRNLKKISDNPNLPSALELPIEAIEEIIANMIAHRDYFIDSSNFINMYDNRIEFISCGKLPNSLDVETIKKGIHRDRNPIILNFLEKDKEFKYSGMGRGIERILHYCKKEGIKVEFINDKNKNLFKVILFRKEG